MALKRNTHTSSPFVHTVFVGVFAGASFVDTVLNRSIEDLKEQVTAGSDMDVLSLCESYMTTFPYMKHSALVYLLAGAWEVLSTRNSSQFDKLRKKVLVILADAKADPEVIAAAEGKRDAANKICIRSNQKVVKMRALKDIYLKKEASNSLPTMEVLLKDITFPAE